MLIFEFVKLGKTDNLCLVFKTIQGEADLKSTARTFTILKPFLDFLKLEILSKQTNWYHKNVKLHLCRVTLIDINNIKREGVGRKKTDIAFKLGFFLGVEDENNQGQKLCCGLKCLVISSFLIIWPSLHYKPSDLNGLVILGKRG